MILRLELVRQKVFKTFVAKQNPLLQSNRAPKILQSGHVYRRESRFL